MINPVHRWKEHVTFTDGRPSHWTFDGRPCWLATGVEDKNGVEIYEGDIISVLNHDSPFTVMFVNSAFWLVNNGMKCYLTYFRNSKLEVIGHIAEEQQCGL